MKHGSKTKGGNGGYSKKSAVSRGTPRTPKNAGNTGKNTVLKRAQDGTRMNSGK
jgi:hypothetical protein